MKGDIINNVVRFFPNEKSFFIKLFKCFGLFPYSKNTFHQILLVTLSLFLIILGAIGLFDVFLLDDESDTKGPIDFFAIYLLLSGYVLSQISCTVEALLTVRVHTKLLKLLHNIDYLLYRLNKDNDYRISGRKKITKLIILLFLCTYLTFNQMFQTQIYEKHGYFLLFFLPIVRLRCIQFIFYTDTIVLKLDVLAKMILEIEKTNPNANPSIISSDLLNHPKSSELVFNRLFLMKHIYGKLWRSVDMINQIFGVSLLFIIANDLVNLTVEAYWCYFSFFGNNPIEKGFGKLAIIIF